jgi:hypothetical protein
MNLGQAIQPRRITVARLFVNRQGSELHPLTQAVMEGNEILLRFEAQKPQTLLLRLTAGTPKGSGVAALRSHFQKI